MKTAALYLLLALPLPALSAPCPAAGQTDARRLTAPQLIEILHVNPKAAQEIKYRIESDSPENARELGYLLADYDTKAPPNLVACPPEFSFNSALGSDVSVNINSVSLNVLSKLKDCGVSGAAIAALHSRNNDPATPGFRSVNELNAFFTARHLPQINRNACQGVSLALRP